MNIEIKNRFNGEIIISGKYDSYTAEQIAEYKQYIDICAKFAGKKKGTK